MNPKRRIPILAGWIISLIIATGLIGAGESAFARGAAHHPPHAHRHQPPKTSIVDPSASPPFCHSDMTHLGSILCINMPQGESSMLSMTPDCPTLVVTDSTGQLIPRTVSGGWTIKSTANWQVTFSLDGTGCANGTYQFSIDQPTWGHIASFSQTF